MADERNEGMGGGAVAADELRLLIERAERLVLDVVGDAPSAVGLIALARRIIQLVI